jgi:pimeloyl-ACP methyl ester carboxylesterase
MVDPRPLDVAVHVDDALAVLDAEAVADAIVVGHSFGAVVALELAARHPGRVKAVVAWEPPYAPLADPATRALIADAGAATVRAHAAGGAPAAAETFVRAVAGDAALEALRGRSRDFILGEGDGALVDSSMRGLEPGGLARVAVPVVIAVGAASDPFYLPIADRLARRIPAARLVVLPGLRHPAPITDSQPIAALVGEVLAALDAASRAEGTRSGPLPDRRPPESAR